MESILSILLFIGFLYLMMRFGCGAHIHRAGCGHSSHGHIKSNGGPFKSVTRDPVCGMEVEVGRAAGLMQHGPDTYYFCSKKCLRKFQETPNYFLESTSAKERHVA